MNVTRLYSDTNGDTHFADFAIKTKPAGAIGLLSDRITVKDLIFREVEAVYNYDFHNTPQKQYLVLLDGIIEIETSLGEKRIFKQGDVLLLEDITGKGHRSRNITSSRRNSLFITIP